MAMFGFGAQQDPFQEAAQKAQDQQTAFEGMKDNLPALGLIAGLSILARNNGTRNVGQLIGMAGGDSLNAYGTWQKMQEVKKRQEMLDKERQEDREYGRSQDAFKNDMAERRLAMEQAQMAFNQNIARQRLGMAAAAHALARQNALKGNWAMTDSGYLINRDTGEMRLPTVDGKALQLGAGGVDGMGGLGMPKLTDSAKKEVANLMAMRDALDDAQSQFTASGGKYNGFVNGRTPNWARGSDDAYKAQLLESGIGKMNAAFRKDTSGQAVTESELKLLNEWLPSMTDTDEVFGAKFENLNREWLRRAKSLSRAYNIPLEALMPSSFSRGSSGQGAGAGGAAGAGIPSDIKWGGK